MQCSYILNSVRFRTDSNSVRKTNLKKFQKKFRTELDSVRKQKNVFKPRNNFRTESNLVRKKNILEGKQFWLNTVWFGKLGNIFKKIAHLPTWTSAHLLICSSALHQYQHQCRRNQHQFLKVFPFWCTLKRFNNFGTFDLTKIQMLTWFQSYLMNYSSIIAWKWKKIN